MNEEYKDPYFYLNEVEKNKRVRRAFKLLLGVMIYGKFNQ